MKNTTLPLLVFLLLIAGIAYIDHMLRYIDKAKVIRDCSLTGTHIIDEKTIVVCQVLKVQDTPANTPSDKKPEVTL